MTKDQHMPCWSFVFLVDRRPDPDDIDECHTECYREIKSCQHEQFGELMPIVLHVHKIVELQYNLDECKTEYDRNRELSRNYLHACESKCDERQENHQPE